MRSIIRTSLVSAAALALIGGMALPASAADTDATVQIQGGSIALAAPASFNLGAVAPGQSAQANLTGIGVTDDRAGETGWVSSVSVSDFTGTTNPAEIIPAANVSYVTGDAVTTGTATVTSAGTVTGFPTLQTVQTATSVHGNNTATWDATIEIAAPADAVADTYTATIVHSVS